VISMRGLVASKWPASSRKQASSRGKGAPAAGGIFSALRIRNYRLFWFGQLISVTGTFMQSTAQAWLVLTLTSNPLALGIIGALQFGPLLVPFGGAIGDRFPRRWVLVATQIAAGLLALILFALTLTHLITLWQLYLLALGLGIVNAVDMPTRQAFVSEMVPTDNLLNAVSLNSAQFNMSRIVGPGLAGLAIALFGMPPLFFFNAISYIAVIIGLLLMRPAELVPQPRAMLAHGLARIRAMGDGFRFMLSDPIMRVTLLMIAVAGTLGFNFNVLLPLEARTQLGVGPQIFGLLTSSLGVGALIGALTLAKRGGAPTNKLLISMAGAFGVLEAAAGLTRSVPVALVLIAFTGFFMSSFSAAANTRTQLASPPEIRGRVMSVYTMVFVGTTPIGNLLVSGVASGAGVTAGWLVSGIPCLLVAIAAAWLWRRSPSRAAVREQVVEAPAPVAGTSPAMALPAPPVQPLPELLPRRSAAARARHMPGMPRPQPRAAHRD
jgi:MFS family permease